VGTRRLNGTVREAAPRDADSIAALSGQLGYPASGEEIRARLETVRRRGDGRVWVSELDGAVVGWGHAQGVHVLESPAHAEVVGLVVDRDLRGRGIGAALMAEAERWAAAEGYTMVRVRSNVVRVDAHRFYERLGFVEAKRQAVFAKRLEM